MQSFHFYQALTDVLDILALSLSSGLSNENALAR